MKLSYILSKAEVALVLMAENKSKIAKHSKKKNYKNKKRVIRISAFTSPDDAIQYAATYYISGLTSHDNEGWWRSYSNSIKKLKNNPYLINRWE